MARTLRNRLFGTIATFDDFAHEASRAGAPDIQAGCRILPIGLMDDYGPSGRYTMESLLSIGPYSSGRSLRVHSFSGDSFLSGFDFSRSLFRGKDALSQAQDYARRLLDKGCRGTFMGVEISEYASNGGPVPTLWQ